MEGRAGAPRQTRATRGTEGAEQGHRRQSPGTEGGAGAGRGTVADRAAEWRRRAGRGAPQQTEPQRGGGGRGGGGQGHPCLNRTLGSGGGAGAGRGGCCSMSQAAGGEAETAKDGLKHRGRHAACPLPSQGFKRSASEQPCMQGRDLRRRRAGVLNWGFLKGAAGLCIQEIQCVAIRSAVTVF